MSIIFRALGCLSDKEILYFIKDNDNSELDEKLSHIIQTSLLIDTGVQTQGEAIAYISRKLSTNYTFNSATKISYCKNILEKEYLLHLSDNLSKLHFTGLMVNRLLKCYLKVNIPPPRLS